MPLPPELLGMKVAPLGNFHDNTGNLPPFYQNYQVLLEKDFEVAIGNRLSDAKQGANALVQTSNLNYNLYFDSETHIVLRRIGDKYVLYKVYRNADKKGGVVRERSCAADPYKSYDPITKENSQWRIRGVFSTQFSSCGLQMGLLGETKDAPEYLSISHLQNRSCLASIAGQIQIGQENIHAILSIMFPHVDSCTDAHYGLANVRAKSVILLRDANLWPAATIWSGFGMMMCGFILEGTSLRLAMIPVSENPFTTASVLNVTNLPIFCSTPMEIRRQIRAMHHPQVAAKAPEQLQDYYFSLFKDGYLGDKYYTTVWVPRNTCPLQLEIKRRFLAQYKPDSIAEFRKFFTDSQDLPRMLFPLKKFIAWQRAFSPKEIINGIGDFVPTDVNETFRDMAIAPVNQAAQQLQAII